MRQFRRSTLAQADAVTGEMAFHWTLDAEVRVCFRVPTHFAQTPRVAATVSGIKGRDYMTLVGNGEPARVDCRGLPDGPSAREAPQVLAMRRVAKIISHVPAACGR